MKLLTKWFRGLHSRIGEGESPRPACPRRARLQRPSSRPGFDHLEDRCVPTTGWGVDTASSFNYGVAVDSEHNAVYLAGSAVAKYTTSGTLLWSQSLGNGSNYGNGAVVNSAGDALYVTGNFTGVMNIGGFTLSTASGVPSADRDIFVAKFDASGQVLWAKRYGSLGSDQGLGIAADATGIYVTGGFSATVAFDSQTLTSPDLDAFLVKLDANGNVVYATQSTATAGRAGGRALAVDGSGQVYLFGSMTGSANFGSTTLGASPGFAAKVDAAGNFVWAAPVGGLVNGAALDAGGHLYMTGNFGGTAAFGATILTSASTDTVVARVDPESGTFLWAKQLGGSARSTGVRLAVDSFGNVYTAAYTTSTGFIDADPGPGYAILSTSNVSSVGFVAALNPDGEFLNAWQTTGNSSAAGIALDAEGNIYFGGNKYATSVSVDIGTQIVTLNQSQNPGYFAQIARTKSTIFGQAFNDLNRNGVQDASETPFAGVTVYIDTNNNGVRNTGEPTATTNALGGFSFNYLAPGAYTIRVVAPSGYSATTAAALTVTTTAGQGNSASTFGIGRTPQTTTYTNSTAVSTSTGSPNAISTLAIGDSYFIQTMSITIKVTNTALKPLTINLVAPDGTVVTLAANVKSNGTVTFNVPAAVGKNVNGTWRLEVLGLAGGKLNSWSLSVFG